MKVRIGHRKILIDGHTLEYYPYYFAIWKDSDDHRLTVKNVLSQWSTALSSLKDGEGEVYLPYYLNDQACRFLKAELEGGNVVLTDVLVRDDGWAMDLDDLSREIYSVPEIIESYATCDGDNHDSEPKLFGRLSAKELIDALATAEIADT